MPFNMKFQVTASMQGSSFSVSGAWVEVGNVKIAADLTTPADSTGVELPISFTLAGLQGISFVSDKGCTLHLIGPAGTQDIALLPGITYDWSKSTGEPNPFAGDVASATVDSAIGQWLRVLGVSN